MAMADSVAAVKSAVYSVQLSLLEGISDERKLDAAGRILTQSEYADVVTERTITNMCGYPLCAKSLPSTFPHRGRFHISLREHKVYDVQETRLFCSSDCLILSKSFAGWLSVDREHSMKTLELATAFHNLQLLDFDDQKGSALAAEKMPMPKEESRQEFLQETHMQEAPRDIPRSPEKLNVPVRAEHMVTQQNLSLKSDTVLLIREQDEIKTTVFNTAGPPDAIEGYVPQKDFQPSRCNQDTAEGNTKSDDLSSTADKYRFSSSSKIKLKSKNKATTLSKSKESKRTSSEIQSEFTSCVFLNQGQSAMLSDADCRSGPASNHMESLKEHVSLVNIDEQVSMQNMGWQRSKKQNRVSWADHNNLDLVEDLSSSAVASCSGVLKDVSNSRLHAVEDDQAVTTDILPSGEVDVAFEGSSEFLQREEIFNHQGEHINMESAKALATALTEAADAVAHGEVDSTEAVARAGISILSPHEEAPASHPLDHFVKEIRDLEKESTDEVENVDPRDCWFSAPPKDFKPELSAFGTLWMALDGWISAASIAHVYGRDSTEENEFAFLNGKEYFRQVIIPNGFSAEIERTIAGCISRALPGLVETLRFPVPVSTLEVSLGRFLRTMTFMTAIPPLSSKQWQVVVLLFLDALSVHRLPVLRIRFSNGRQLLQKVLASANVTEAEYEIFRDLVLPVGMLPDFAARCGG